MNVQDAISGNGQRWDSKKNPRRRVRLGFERAGNIIALKWTEIRTQGVKRASGHGFGFGRLR